MMISGEYGNPSEFCPVLWESNAGRSTLLWVFEFDIWNFDRVRSAEPDNPANVKVPKEVWEYAAQRTYNGDVCSDYVRRILVEKLAIVELENSTVPIYVTDFMNAFLKDPQNFQEYKSILRQERKRASEFAKQMREPNA
ncbi:MAG: hypothetical protein R2688_02355 [Fimbriimonadaceae bacterium]